MKTKQMMMMLIKNRERRIRRRRKIRKRKIKRRKIKRREIKKRRIKRRKSTIAMIQKMKRKRMLIQNNILKIMSRV